MTTVDQQIVSDVARSFNVKMITLFESTAIRYDESPLGEEMDVNVSIENEIGEVVNGFVECQSVCSLTVKNGPKDVALFISHYRPFYEVEPAFAKDLVLKENKPVRDALNDLVLQQVYPYHRQLLSDTMSRMNLPVFLLPALAPSKLLRQD
ncbi:hypothetical protein AB4Y88_08305 [Paenarthrobacter sp. RAF9]